MSAENRRSRGGSAREMILGSSPKPVDNPAGLWYGLRMSAQRTAAVVGTVILVSCGSSAPAAHTTAAEWLEGNAMGVVSYVDTFTNALPDLQRQACSNLSGVAAGDPSAVATLQACDKGDWIGAAAAARAWCFAHNVTPHVENDKRPPWSLVTVDHP